MRDIFMSRPMNSLESIAVSIASLNKPEVTRRLRNFKGRFSLDFSDDYLEGLSVDRLRHILLAAVMTNLKKQNN